MHVNRNKEGAGANPRVDVAGRYWDACSEPDPHHHSHDGARLPGARHRLETRFSLLGRCDTTEINQFLR